MRPIRWLRRGVTLLTISAAGAAAAVTVRHLLDTPQPLESSLPGEGHIDRKHGGNLYYNVAGDAGAQPLVLLHDFYPGASNYEFRRVFPRFAVSYRVFAPDWLGFGMSEHPHVAYTGEFYANMLTGFLRDVVSVPASVIAMGRAANIAVRAASDTPEIFESLVLVSPYALAGIELEPSLRQTLARTAQRTSLGLVPYAVLATRPILRRQQTARTAHADDPAAREAAVQQLFASAHQFGGHHALLALLTGELDLPMQNALSLMEPPALIVSGADDPSHPREDMEDLAILSPHTDLEVIPGAGASVVEDQPAAFTEVVTRWLKSERQRQVARDEALLPRLDSPAPSQSVPPDQADAELREAPLEVKSATRDELTEQAPEVTPPPKATSDRPASEADAASEAPARPASEDTVIGSAMPVPEVEQSPTATAPQVTPAPPPSGPMTEPLTAMPTPDHPAEPQATEDETPTAKAPAQPPPARRSAATPPVTPPSGEAPDAADQPPPRSYRSAPTQPRNPTSRNGRPRQAPSSGTSGEGRSASDRQGNGTGHEGGGRNGHRRHGERRSSR
jgi:pimeloyl-ACP methyl ester carboxylesterase